MIDSMTSLAFSVYSNKGVYALMLGSGVSRSAGIPTGWDVVLDLINKVADVEGGDCEGNPEKWFREKFGEEPDYSKLLDALAKTPAERQQLLKGYFEPTPEDSEEGIKQPTESHHAIAKLVANGFIQVVVTTNFDRLLEKALEEVGITPVVISTPDQIQGAPPLAHSDLTIVKVHGDYLDQRIKNTETELGEYEDSTNRLLDQIFDEYGLIVCGWSGDWDPALRAAIERCPSRRFTTFWTTRSPLEGDALRVLKHRQGQELRIENADQFFQQLEEKVSALTSFGGSHPLSPKIAVATVKRYLVDPTAKIRLRDLVHEETERLMPELSLEHFPPTCQVNLHEEIRNRVGRYESLTQNLLAILITGSYWGDREQTELWVRALERLGTLEKLPNNTSITTLTSMRAYPALLCFYGIGIAALAGDRYETLAQIFLEPQAFDGINQRGPFCSMLIPFSVFEANGKALALPNEQGPPVNAHLVRTLREPLKDFLPQDRDYEMAFDRFEFLLSMVHADRHREEYNGGWHGPTGRFAWRNVRRRPEDDIASVVENEIAEQKENWPPVKAGLFNSDSVQANTARLMFRKFLEGFSRG